jgi:hypothetical protein
MAPAMNDTSRMPRPIKNDIYVRDDGGQEIVAVANSDPMRKDHGHGAFEHGEGDGAEKEHDQKNKTPDRLAVFQEYPHLFRQRGGIARYHHFYIGRQGLE